MFDQLLESFHRDDSYNLSNIGFSEEIMQLELFKNILIASYLELCRAELQCQRKLNFGLQFRH